MHLHERGGEREREGDRDGGGMHDVLEMGWMEGNISSLI
jgi:hypothetical protein